MQPATCLLFNVHPLDGVYTNKRSAKRFKEEIWYNGCCWLFYYLRQFLKICGKRNKFIKHFFSWTCSVFQKYNKLTMVGEKWLLVISIENKYLIGFPHFYTQSCWLQRPLLAMSPHIYYLNLKLSLGRTSATSLKHQIRRCWLDKRLLLPANPLSVTGYTWLGDCSVAPLTAPGNWTFSTMRCCKRIFLK